MKRTVIALSLALAACAPPRMVAPLRYEAAAPAPDEPFRAARPATGAAAPLPTFAVEEATLGNGVRVAVVTRHGHGRVAARLSFTRDIVDLDDAAAVRSSLIAPVLFASDDGEPAAGWCGVVGCSVRAESADDELASVLDRIARLAVDPPAPGAAAATRLQGERVRRGRIATSTAMENNVRAALFRDTPYGQPETMNPEVTLGELVHLRDAAMTPSCATLVVVGDVSLSTVLPVAEARFGSWRAREGASYVSTTRPPFAAVAPGRRVILVQAYGTAQLDGRVVARGPKPTDRDYVPLAVLVGALGGSRSSTTYAHVRETLVAGYRVGGELAAAREASTMELGGSFDPDKAVAGLASLVEAVRALRRTGIAPDALSLAKATALADWRAQMATNAGVAQRIGSNAMIGAPLDPDEAPVRIAAVTAADVQRVARRWLAEDQLRAIFVGEVTFLTHDIGHLNMGDHVVRDGNGRDQ